MNFLYPGFLFALTAVAIPVLIHLFNFRKYTKVYFSNVGFIKEIKEQDSSREQLKNILLLLVRVLAVCFLVLAFARPYFSSENHVNPNFGNVLSIYIDNSYSMEAVNQDGSLLDEAKRRAKEIAKSYGLNAKFKLITNDFEGKHQRLVRYEEFLSLLDEVKISASYRSLQQVIHRAESDHEKNTNHYAYLISDFQQGFAGSVPVSSDPLVPVFLVRLQSHVLPNIAVDSVWFLSEVHKPGDAEKLVVKLKNYTSENAVGVPLKLRVDNSQKAAHRINIAASGTINDTLSFSGMQNGWHKGVVQVKDYPITFDDQLNFTFKVEASRKILNVKGDPAEKHIDAMYGADPYFRVTDMPESNIIYSDFEKYDLIVLNGLKAPSSGLAQQIKIYLQHGGTVALFPDLDSPQAPYNQFLNALSLPPVSGIRTEQLTVNDIDLKNELFKGVFEQVPANIDLPKVNRYFTYSEQNRKEKQNLMTLPPNQLFFAKYRLSSGMVYLAATSLNIKDSNFPQHPVFVPLMYKVAFGSSRSQPLNYAIGTDLLESEKISLNANQTLRLVSEDFEAIPELRQASGKTLIYVADQVRRPAFYDLKKADSVVAVYAFNQDKRESEMKYASDQDLQKLFPAHQIKVYDSRRDALTLDGNAKNNSTDLWKLCLVLCAVFLAVEILLIRFFNNTKNIQKT